MSISVWNISAQHQRIRSGNNEGDSSIAAEETVGMMMLLKKRLV
jgi:hypothetical protein